MKLGWFEFVAYAYRGVMPLPIYDERVLLQLEMGDPLDVFIPLIEKIFISCLIALPHCEKICITRLGK